jgi:hypothetical protein
MKIIVKLKAILAYVLAFALVIGIIDQFLLPGILEDGNFIIWDASNYNYIRENGYSGDKTAFFPLFPLVWKWLSLGPYGIVLLNAALFFLSFYWLLKNLNIKKLEEIILYLTIPSFIFFFLPYSEALFFLWSSIILIGLSKHKNYLVYLGLFFATISRPAFTIFIPALIITELIAPNRIKSLQKIGAYVLISGIGVLCVGVIQYADTGEWFKFFSAQKNWGNEPQVPKLPLTSWSDGFIIRTDAFAFLIGILSGVFLSALLLRLRWLKNIKPPKEVIFSLAYIGGITLSVLIFRGGSLFSLNRFILATPFIIVVMNYWLSSNFKLNHKNLLVIFGLLSIFWFLFGSYGHIQLILKFGLLTIYALLLFALKSHEAIIRKYSIYFLIVLNFTFQIIFYLRFLEGKWVG